MISLLIGGVVLFIVAVGGIYLYDFLKNKPQSVKKTNPTVWALNEELQRMHDLFNHARKNYDPASNLQIYWNKINELQKEITKLSNSEPK